MLLCCYFESNPSWYLFDVSELSLRFKILYSDVEAGNEMLVCQYEELWKSPAFFVASCMAMDDNKSRWHSIRLLKYSGNFLHQLMPVYYILQICETPNRSCWSSSSFCIFGVELEAEKCQQVAKTRLLGTTTLGIDLGLYEQTGQMIFIHYSSDEEARPRHPSSTILNQPTATLSLQKQTYKSQH